MKKISSALIVLLTLSFLCACGKKADEHAESPGSFGQEVFVGVAPADSGPDVSGTGESGISFDTAGESDASPDSIGENNASLGTIGESRTSSNAAESRPGGESDGPYDVYPYDIEADRAVFDVSDPDIVVGDRLYATQINDWYLNFEDYEGKVVEIEGYYIDLDGYDFVGRKGPACPYCSGGYVSFEFSTDADLFGWISEISWIRVTGVLREGSMYPGGGQDPYPFYYIEALRAEEMEAAGVGTVTD